MLIGLVCDGEGEHLRAGWAEAVLDIVQGRYKAAGWMDTAWLAGECNDLESLEAWLRAESAHEKKAAFLTVNSLLEADLISRCGGCVVSLVGSSLADQIAKWGLLEDMAELGRWEARLEWAFHAAGFNRAEPLLAA
jgi:hypothetical protein